MKKKARDLKKADKISIGSDILVIDSIEVSDMGKQGMQKCRIVALKGAEKVIIIRPADYPFETK